MTRIKAKVTNTQPPWELSGLAADTMVIMKTVAAAQLFLPDTSPVPICAWSRAVFPSEASSEPSYQHHSFMKQNQV